MPKYLGNTTARNDLTAVGSLSGNSVGSTTSVSGASASITGTITYGTVTDSGNNVELTPGSQPQSAFIRSATGVPRFFRFRAGGSPVAPCGTAFSFQDSNHFYFNNVNAQLNLGYNTGTFSGLTFTSPVVTISSNGTITTSAGNIAAPSGSLSGASASITGTASVGSLNSTGAVSGTTGTFSGTVQANALSSTTSVSGATASISGTASVGSLSSSGAVNGTGGNFFGTVTFNSLNASNITCTNLTVTNFLFPVQSRADVIYSTTTPSTNALNVGSITVYYQLLGNQVTVTIPERTGTAADTIATNAVSYLAVAGSDFTLPVFFRPPAIQRYYNVIYKNGTETILPSAFVSPDGRIAASIQNWTSGQTLVFPGRTITYLVY